MRRIARKLTIPAIVWSLALAAPALADSSAATDVKAGFVYNFSKFVDWPSSALPPEGNMRLCVLGRGLDGKLSNINGRVSQGREIQVLAMGANSALDNCHILYIGAMEKPRLSELLQRVSDSPVLTVSDMDDFTSAGGMIGLFVEHERVRFAINLSAMRAVGLKPSAQLVRLGRVEQ